jgi:asparagine synthase (glutamine-hydrolysing)
MEVDAPARGRALAAIAHRGPDAGVWQSFAPAGRPVHLGHRRLSIIDLSQAANQPFHKDGLAIVFNGEIYNYRALRAELEALGARFITTSDTEVLLEAFRHWGDGCYHRLRGMFAFAILDEKTASLTLARDPFGIKPLYVHLPQRGGLAFASEMKALFAAGIRAEINPDAILASMMFLFTPENIASFNGIEKLPPGSWLRTAPGGVTRGRFFDPAADLWDNRPPPVTIEALRAVLEDSVAAHMVADVPVSTFLSGGLDSSLITVLAARHNPRLEAYTIRMRGDDLAMEGMPQDVLYARKLARDIGIKLHEIEIAPDIDEWLPRMMATLEEPTSDAATLNVMLICDAARQAGAKVLLSGQGADEFFGGYRRHRAQMIAAHYRRLPAPLRRAMAAMTARMPVTAFGRGLTGVRWAKRYLSFADRRSPADSYLRSYTYFDADGLRALAPGLDMLTHDAIMAGHRAVFERLEGADLPNRMGFADLHYFLPALNLTYTDRASMFASTEVRVPFVDLEVARAAFSLPGARKTDPFRTKIALKQAAEAYLPREIIYRPKASFGAPLRAWMQGALSERVRALAHEGRLARAGYICAPAVETMIADFANGRADYSYQLWHLLALETWLEWAESVGASSSAGAA